MSGPPRLRQAVIAARDLEAVAGQLREELGLGEPFADPAVGYFGLHNAVFALGDTFLEVVSPVRHDTAAGRLIDRRGGDCGYMVMFQVSDLAAARERAHAERVREVFAVDLEDIHEVHLHPADMRAAIVALSQPDPPESWRWGGPGWAERGAGLALSGVEVAVADPAGVGARWERVIGGLDGVSLSDDSAEPGLIEIRLTGRGAPPAVIELGRVRVVVSGPDDRPEDH